MRKTIDRKELVEVLKKAFAVTERERIRARKEKEDVREYAMGIRGNEIYSIMECVRKNELHLLY